MPVPHSRKWLLAATTLGLLGSMLPLLLWRKAPQLRAQVAPQGLAVGERLHYADTTYTDSSRHHWRWEFGQGAVSTRRSGTFRYQKPGTYRVRLTVDDDQELQQEFVVQVKAPPTRPDSTIRLLGPATGYPEEQLLFRTQGAPAHQFTWDFGDGTPPSHDPIAFHAYAREGPYRVRLTTDVARPLVQRVVISTRFRVSEKGVVVDTSLVVIQRHLQAIAEGRQVNWHYDYLLDRHLGYPDLPVVAGGQPPSDFYSYCMNLQFDPGWVIDAVAPVIDPVTGRIVRLDVTQHKDDQ